MDSGNDLEKVEQVRTGVLRANRPVMQEAQTSAVVAALQECAAGMTVRSMGRGADYWKALHALQKETQKALNAAEILLPVTLQAPGVRNKPLSPLTEPASTQHWQPYGNPGVTA